MGGRISYLGGIVKDGLILDLDAAKRDSYSGIGTAWLDISGNRKNGTLTNGPTFNSTNGGSIVFDGTNDYTTFFGDTFGYSPGVTGEVSLEIWVYPTGPYTSYVSEGLTNLGGFFGQSYFNNSTGWGLGMFTQGGVNYFVFQVRNFGTVVQPSPNVVNSFTNNNWYHLTGSFSRNDFSRLYVNGINVGSANSTTLNGISITPNVPDAAIGRSGAQQFYAGSRISQARIYSRSLSATEVLQNYNATKGRYL